MFQTFQNSVQISFTLVPDGPVLVRSQNTGLDPAIADVEFKRTVRNGVNTVFLAGSGLKGVIRAHCERLLRSAGMFACDPTNTRDRDMCGNGKFKREHTNPAKYPHKQQCAACFTFGSMQLAGRFRIGDAYPPEDLMAATNRTEVRTGVGINRRLQSAAQGVLYDTEVVVDGGFAVTLSGENFALWQLGLIAQALRDLDSGFVPIGGCKSRGMGTVQVRDIRLGLRFLGGATGSLRGAHSQAYGLKGECVPIREMAGVRHHQAGLFEAVDYRDEGVKPLFDELIQGPLHGYMHGEG